MAESKAFQFVVDDEQTKELPPKELIDAVLVRWAYSEDGERRADNG